MKRILLFIYIFLSLNLMLGISVYAQQRVNGDDKIRAVKVSLITDKMQLNANQSAQFWPVYNRYENEMRIVWHSRRDLTKEKGKTAEEIIDERHKLDEKELLIKSKYKNEFLKVVSAQQLNQMYVAEAEFKRILMERRSKSK